MQMRPAMPEILGPDMLPNVVLSEETKRRNALLLEQEMAEALAVANERRLESFEPPSQYLNTQGYV